MLTEDEYAYCVAEAMRRKESGDRRRLNHASTYRRTDEERVEQEITGTCAEYICRKLLGADLTLPFDTFHKVPDIEPDWEVRSTRREDGRLIVRTNDPDERRYILVTGTPPEMTVHGWITGIDAKQKRFFRNPRGYRIAWFVPQSELRPLDATELDVA